MALPFKGFKVYLFETLMRSSIQLWLHCPLRGHQVPMPVALMMSSSTLYGIEHLRIQRLFVLNMKETLCSIHIALNKHTNLFRHWTFKGTRFIHCKPEWDPSFLSETLCSIPIALYKHTNIVRHSTFKGTRFIYCKLEWDPSFNPQCIAQTNKHV